MIDAVIAVIFALSLLTGWMVIRGFTPHAVERKNSTTFRLSAGITLVVLASIARGFYWGVMPLFVAVVDPAAWAAWIGWSGLSVNVIFSLVFLRGLFPFLVLLWLLFPAADRAGYSIWSAPFYPEHSIFYGLVRFLRFPGKANRGGGND